MRFGSVLATGGGRNRLSSLRMKGVALKIFGHRGAAGYVTENTLESFRKAIELGVDGIEFDVRLTADGFPVVIHDATIDRTSKHSGRVGEMSLAELQEVTAGDLHPIPTLEEAIGCMPATICINVELKEIAAHKPTLKVLFDLVSRGAVRPEQVLVTSFEHEAIELLCEATTEFQVGLLTKGLPHDTYWDLAKRLKVTSANIDLASINSAFVERAHRNDLLVMVYTVNESTDAERLRAMGVDAIFSDFPDRVRSA